MTLCHRDPRILPGAAVVCLLAILAASAPALGQAPPAAPAENPPAGKWSGTVTLPGDRAYTAVFRFERTPDGGWNGAVYPNLESQEPIQPQSLAISGTAITMRWQSDQLSAVAIFTGNYQSWTDAIRGVLMVSDLNMPLMLARVVPPAAEGPLAGEAPPEEPARIRHTTRFAATGHASYWHPIYVLKDDKRNINDITSSSFGWQAGAQWYVLDGLALCARYAQGGLGFDSNEKNLDLFGYTGDEFMDIKGPEVALKAYLGNQLMRDSRLNPYLTFVGGRYDWSVGSDGRGSEPVAIQEEPLEGTNYGFGAGVGTEYAFNGRLALELEWLWRYFMTEDEEKWANVDELWTNTHAWALSLGLVVGF